MKKISVSFNGEIKVCQSEFDLSLICPTDGASVAGELKPIKALSLDKRIENLLCKLRFKRMIFLKSTCFK